MLSPTTFLAARPALRRHPQGFTLIEVMMAATILVVGFVGLIQAVTIGTEMLDTARKQVVAQQIINGEITALRLGSWSQVTAALPSPCSITVNDTGTAATGSLTYVGLTNFTASTTDDNTSLMAVAKGFTCTLTKTWVRSNYYRLTYTVSWTGNTGRSYTRTQQVFFGSNGLQLSYKKA
jgi:prepilin-type N-terminal cleavage/methylation domain-containing protein